MIKKLISLFVFTFILFGCQSVKTPEVELTNLPQVVYKIPSDYSEMIYFNSYNQCVSYGTNGCVRYERVAYERKSNNSLIVERSTHNGVAGSGVTFIISEKIEGTTDGIIVTYKPEKMSSYQDGIILPFPVPDFDIIEYLSNSQFSFNFEINSEYSPSAVKANFDRLIGDVSKGSGLDGNLRGDYKVNLNNSKSILSIEYFPYRNGSKIVVDATVEVYGDNSEIIDVFSILNNLKQKIIEVVNS